MAHDFANLFTEDWNPSYCDHFGFSRVTTAPDDRADFIEALATGVAASKADPAVTADLLKAAGWEVAGAPLRGGTVSVRRGDFGEVVATEAIEALDDLVVPVRKLRYQIDPNQTLPGADVVAFDVGEEGDVSGLQFTESKYRTKPEKAILVKAIDQLEADRQKKFATTLNFLAHRLHETIHPLYTEFMRYLTARGRRDDSYGVCLTCDTEQWTGAPLEEAAELPDLLQPLLVRVVTLDDPNDLIDQVCAKLELELIPDD